jgi:hypothetical protein
MIKGMKINYPYEKKYYRFRIELHHYKKQSYTLVNSLKHFQTYVGYNKIKDFVPYPVVKEILSQQDCLGSRGKWVSQIQQYDLEINPTKMIKGQGIEKMMTKINQEATEVGEKEQVNIFIVILKTMNGI